MIGIFDSGSGGLSVLRAIRARAPLLDIVYFGDLANMPYGNKTQAELLHLTEQAIQILTQAGATQIVSACNSVSASVVRAVPQMESIIEMVGPAVHSIAEAQILHIPVAATPATVQSGMYQKELEHAGIQSEMIACPDLAAAIEHEDYISAQRIINEVVSRACDTGAGALLLACTHYPLVREMFGDRIQIIDPAEAVAKEVTRVCGFAGSGRTQFITSKTSDLFEKRIRKMF